MASGCLEGKIEILSTAQGLAFLSLHGSLFKFVYLTMIQINQIIFERCILEVQNKPETKVVSLLHPSITDVRVDGSVDLD